MSETTNLDRHNYKENRDECVSFNGKVVQCFNYPSVNSTNIIKCDSV